MCLFSQLITMLFAYLVPMMTSTKFLTRMQDIYGRSHPQGTCVLLEAATIDHVVLHFQSLHSDNSQFELFARKYYFLNVAILILQTLSFDKFYLTSKKVVKY